MFLGAALMFGAVVLPFKVPGLLGIAVFFLCFVGAWVVWFKGLPIDRALLAAGITMGCFAAVFFVFEILIGETILGNVIFFLVASFFVVLGLIASIGSLCFRFRASTLTTTLLNVCLLGYGIWLYVWGDIPGGYGP